MGLTMRAYESSSRNETVFWSKNYPSGESTNKFSCFFKKFKNSICVCRKSILWLYMPNSFCCGFRILMTTTSRILFYRNCPSQPVKILQVLQDEQTAIDKYLNKHKRDRKQLAREAAMSTSGEELRLDDDIIMYMPSLSPEQRKV